MTKKNEIPTAFISYSNNDRNYVEKLAKDLLNAGVNVWFDKWEIEVGDSLIEKIQNGISQNDFLIVILSQASVKSNWVKRELNLALMEELSQSKIIVLPVLIEECQIPLFLKEKRYADFRRSYNCGLNELIMSIFAHTKNANQFNPAKSVQTEWGVVRRIAGSFYDAYFLSLSEDATVRVWSIPNGKLVRCLFTRQYPFDARFTKSGKYIVVSTRNNWWERMIVVYDPFSGERVTSFWEVDRSPAVSIACLNEEVLAAIDNKIVSYAIGNKDSKTLHQCAIPIESFAISSDEKFIAISGSNGEVAIGETHGELFQWQECINSQIYDLAIQSNTCILACGISSVDGTLIYNATKKKKLVLPHTDQVSTVSFSSDGTILAAGDWDGGLYLYKAPKWDLIASLQAHPNKIESAAFCYKDQFLITAAGDRGEPSIKIWNLKKGKLECKILGKEFSLANDQIEWDKWCRQYLHFNGIALETL